MSMAYFRSLLFVSPQEQTEELCLEAVREDGYLLECVHHQTEAICIAAVQSEWKALMDVKAQTLAICLAAVEHDGDALDYANLPTDDLLNPASGQLQDWLTLLRACRQTDVHSIDNTLHPLIDAMPLGDVHCESWSGPVDGTRTMLDLLEALVEEMRRLAPDCDKVSALSGAVQQQAEAILRRNWSAPHGDTEPPETQVLDVL